MGTARPLDRLHDHLFDTLHGRTLIYNACWEDPAVDRQALALGPDDHVLVIASAGCNALDYALEGPARISAVDINPRQIALLELKLAGVRALDFDDFFAIFGDGRHRRFGALYHALLRDQLSPFARAYWDRHEQVFSPRGEGVGGLYFHGLAGHFVRGFHAYLACQPGLRRALTALLACDSLPAQREIYDREVAPRLWTRTLNWLLGRQLTMTLLGVPHPQRREVERQHAGGVAGFVQDAVAYVCRDLPLAPNYFWRVYLSGRYTRECCPEYLREANFARLRAGLVDRIEPHVGTVTAFLTANEQPVTRFVLLDHMDWMSTYRPRELAEEWRAIFLRAAPGARILFRSAHRSPTWLAQVSLDDDRSGGVMSRLRFQHELAARLQAEDRVHTYAGFHVADVLPQPC